MNGHKKILLMVGVLAFVGLVYGESPQARTPNIEDARVQKIAKSVKSRMVAQELTTDQVQERFFDTATKLEAGEATGTPRNSSISVTQFDGSEELLMLVNNGRQAELLIGVRDEDGLFELGVHLSTDGEQTNIIQFTRGVVADSLSLSMDRSISENTGSVAAVAANNAYCWALQDGSKVRVICVCRSADNKPWYVCLDTGWIE